ncbi:MAG TPA: SDR family NAD(P)-dependent oxidoreductase, partial [Galbitalea sp.]|nr:SDR family NAD(P)-dependent oxidoreductase [Galbitalea sp.]
MAASIFREDVLAGKRVLITGGGTGLGRGVARYLVDHGAEVHLWGRRLPVLEAAAAEVARGRAGRVFVQSVDVRDAEQVDAAMSQIWRVNGPLTSVINNAAGNFIAPTASLSAHAFEAVSSTVMNGSFNTTHAAGKRWIADGLRGTVL